VIYPNINRLKEQVIGVVGTAEDISEHKKAEEALRKADMLSEAGQLAAGVAHEIRNPLTSLKGFIQLIQKKIYLPVDPRLSALRGAEA
jgi:nitrogen-specific signal transduction histidine kinase